MKPIVPFIVALLLVGAFACSGPEGHRDDASGSATAGDGVGVVATASSGSTATATDGQTVPVATTPPAGDPAATATGSQQPQPTDPAASATAPAAVTPSVAASATATTGAPIEGAILPNKRVISYYGHPNSDQMGILGEYPKEEVLRLLREQAAAFEAADPSRPTVVAFELIATVAQNWPGEDGTYVAYTGDEIIQEYVDFVTANDMILILDLQIGLDTVPNQIEMVRKWLELPNVHLALDPEFSMKGNEIVPNDRIPGEFIGEMNGHDINVAIQMVDEIVRSKGIPPKIFIVHQFEEDMIYNKDVITPLPGVDFVLDMDGFGAQEAKLANYDHFVRDQLIEYGGIKLFYKQDDPLLSPEQMVVLDPPPLVIIYQ